jgi:uncharacterized protein involved in exopolysaccharide biosynthesis
LREPSRPNEPLVDLTQLIKAAVRSWRVLLLALAGGVLVGVVYFFVAPRLYSSQALLSVENEAADGLSGMLSGQFGALASLAGIEIGQGAGRRAEYLAILRSEGFARRFLRKHELVEPLLERERRGVLRRLKRLVFDRGETDASRTRDAVRYFHREVLQVAEDKKTGLVTVRMEWFDPGTAARWANAFVQQFNDEVRSRDGRTAGSRLNFLRQESERNRTREIQQSIAKLMERELNTIMVTNVQQDYALRVLEPAIATPRNQPDEPRLTVYAFLGAFVGLMLGLLLSLYRRRAEWWPA